MLHILVYHSVAPPPARMPERFHEEIKRSHVGVAAGAGAPIGDGGRG